MSADGRAQPNDSRFEQLYKSAARFRHVSPQVRPLLRHTYAAAVVRPIDRTELKNALEALLSFLASEGGRTDANCCTTDAFFAAGEQWEQPWSGLPDDFRQLFDDMGGTLHDAIYAAHIARTFESTPEQLLARVRALD